MKKLFLSLLTLALSVGSIGFAYANDDEKQDGVLRASVNVQADLNTSVKSDVRLVEKKWEDWSINPGVVGTVTAVSSNTITIKTGENGKVYTVDASNAKIQRKDVVIGTSSIVAGDVLFVQGVLNGNTVVAASIIAAKSATDIKKPSNDYRSGLAGTVTAVNSTSISILSKDGKTYTVDASKTKIWKDKKETTAIATITKGDIVLVQGTISGSAVVATDIYVVRLPEKSANAGISGTVTAMSGDTITLLATSGTTYSVDTDDAKFRSYREDNNKNNDNDADIGDIDVGDKITVQGEVSGTNIDATTVTEIKLGGGFFHRFGLFFKNLFHKNK